MTSSVISAIALIGICLFPISASEANPNVGPHSYLAQSTDLLRLTVFGPYGSSWCGDGSGSPNHAPGTMMCFSGMSVWFVCTGSGYSPATGGAQWQTTQVDCGNPPPAP